MGLAKNDIGSEGLKKFCEDISTNRFLHDIDLKQNLIDSNGVTALVSMLKEHLSLERIDLGDNKNLGNNGVKALAEALKTRYTISKLVMTRKTK